MHGFFLFRFQFLFVRFALLFVRFHAFTHWLFSHRPRIVRIGYTLQHMAAYFFFYIYIIFICLLANDASHRQMQQNDRGHFAERDGSRNKQMKGKQNCSLENILIISETCHKRSARKKHARYFTVGRCFCCTYTCRPKLDHILVVLFAVYKCLSVTEMFFIVLLGSLLACRANANANGRIHLDQGILLGVNVARIGLIKGRFIDHSRCSIPVANLSRDVTCRCPLFSGRSLC